MLSHEAQEEANLKEQKRLLEKLKEDLPQIEGDFPLEILREVDALVSADDKSILISLIEHKIKEYRKKTDTVKKDFFQADRLKVESVAHYLTYLDCLHLYQVYTKGYAYVQYCCYLKFLQKYKEKEDE